MTGDEQVILKAACVQAAATLVAVWWPLFRPNIQVSQQELEGHACTFEPADGAKGPAWVTLIRREAEGATLSDATKTIPNSWRDKQVVSLILNRHRNKDAIIIVKISGYSETIIIPKDPPLVTTEENWITTEPTPPNHLILMIALSEKAPVLVAHTNTPAPQSGRK